MANIEEQAVARSTPVAVRIDALCSINRGDDIPCTFVELADNRASILSPVPVQEADEVIFSLPQIGILEAIVETKLYGGFTVSYPAKADSKLGLYLQALKGHGEHRSQGRDFKRIVPIRRLVAVEPEGDAPTLVRILELSCSGVAFTSGVPFKPTRRVKVGAHPASIVRTFDGGAAARFDHVLAEEGFSSLIDLTAVSGPVEAPRVSMV